MRLQRLRIILLLFYAVGFLSYSGLQAQITSSGKDFWFTFMQNIDEPNRTYDLKVFISSDVNASGTISVPGKGWSTNFNVSANNTTVLTVPTDVGHMTSSEVIEGKGIRITSNEDINVFAMNYSINTTDGSLILPVNAIGGDYYILTYNPLFHSEFAIVAPENNTTVRIIPSVNTRNGKPAGVPFEVTLQRGQVYQVQSSGDLTGSRVFATSQGKKIAVFGGATCVNIPPGHAACDHLFEQMFPNNTLRRNFVAIPYKTRTKGDTYRILAIRNGTTVTFNGANPVNLNSGQWHELILTNPTYISSNYPISVAQYSHGMNFDGVQNADPFFIMLSPVEQTREDITFEVFNFPNITGNYVNIAALTSCRSQIRLDGAPVTGWTTLSGNPTYSFAQVTVSQGPHRLTAPKDCGFNAYVYGYGSADSYGYSAGVRLDTLSIAVTANTDCAGNETEFFVSSYPYPIVNYQWNFGDGGTSTQAKPRHVYQTGGTYTVRLIVTYDNSERDTVVQQFAIAEPKADFNFTGGECGNRTVVFTDQSTVVGGSITNRDWVFGDGQTSNQLNPTHTYTNYGTYKVRLIITTRNGCTDTVIKDVKVTPPVTTNAPKEYEVCFGSSVQIGGDVLTGSGSYQYSWSPATDLSATNIAKPIASPSVTRTYTVRITDAEGCFKIDTITVIVNPLPAVELGNDVETCLNVPINIGANATSGTGTYSYKWTPATGLNNDNAAIVSATPQSTTKYTVTVTDSKGCVTTDSITVIILPLPEPRITPAGPIDICSCDSVILDAGDGFVAYNWSTNETTRFITVRQTGSYTVTVTDTNGCINTSPPVSVNVIVPEATVTFGNPTYSVSPGETISIPVYISQSAHLDFCNSRNFVMNMSFNKYIMVPANAANQGTFDNEIRRIQLSGTRDSNSDTLLILQFMGTLGHITTSDIVFDSFDWTDCNFDNQTITSRVNLTDLCEEGNITRLFRSPELDVAMLIYPNPVTGETDIKYHFSNDAPAKIFITDITSRMTNTLFEGIVKKGEHNIKYDASKLANGYYLVIITTPSGSVSTIMEVLK